MKTAKKVLGVVLALAMLVNVFAMISYALAPDTAVDLRLVADKASYNPGDLVTFTVYVQADELVGDLRIGSQHCFGYNSAAIEVLNKTDAGKDKICTTQGFVAYQDGFDESISGAMFTSDLLDAMGDTLDEGHDWTDVVCMIIADDGLTAFSASEEVKLYSFQMKVQDDAPAGEYYVDFNVGSYINYTAYQNDNIMGGIYGYDDDYYGVTVNYGFTGCTIKVAGEDAGPVVDRATTAGQQVKFTTNAPESNGVDDAFKLRVKSVITDADWDTYFYNTEDGGSDNAITEVGIVAYQGTDGFDAETAKKVVNGESADKYSTAGTNYIQKASDDSDAYFGAIILLKHTTCDFDITYMGYAKYLDAEGSEQIIFYETEYVAGVSTNYDTAVSNFLAQ